MKIKPATQADLARIEAAARADGHTSFLPTHFMENERGEVRGCFSAGSFSLIFFWSHTGNAACASLKQVAAAKAAAAELGRPVLWPCTVESPFAPHMEKMGFEILGHANLWRLKNE